MIIFRLLLATVLLAPLPFASVYPWGWGTMAIIIGGLLIAWSVLVLRDPAQCKVPVQSVWPSGALFLAVLGWGLVQAAPWTPIAWQHPLWREAADAFLLPYHGSVSLNPGKSISSVVRLTTYGGIFWLSLQYCRDSDNALRLIKCLSITSFIYSLYGLVTFFSGNHLVLWREKWAYFDDLTSVFVNRNHFATYSGLGLLCTTALFFRSLSLWTRGQTSGRESLLLLIKFFERNGWAYPAGIVVIAASVLLTHSRGGLASTLIGLAIFCASLFVTRPHRRGVARQFSAVCLVLGALFLLASGRDVGTRLANTDMANEERPMVYSATLTAIDSMKLLGSGYGTFEDVFRLYRTPKILEYFNEAHNSYLEIGLELGLVGGGALIFSITLIVFKIGRGVLTREREVVFPCLGIAATALVGSHAMVDFSSQIPAIAATYAAILGAACAQSWSSRKQTSKFTEPSNHKTYTRGEL